MIRGNFAGKNNFNQELIKKNASNFKFCIICIFLMTFVTYGFAVNLPFEKIESNTQSCNSPRKTITADVDKDGQNEIIAASYGSGIIIWDDIHLDASLWTAKTLSSSNHPKDIEIADIDRDGYVDIVACLDTNFVYWNNNVGVWTKNSILSVPADSYTRTIALNDLDNDGDIDIIGSYENNLSDDDGILWIENDLSDTGTWELYLIDPSIKNIYALDVADMDNNGTKEIIAGANNSSWGLYVYFEETPGTWTKYSIDTVENYDALSIGDLNQDGYPDIVSGMWTEGKSLQSFINSGTGKTYTAGIIDPETHYVKSARIIDFDHDGDNDVVASIRNETVWFENTAGDGSVWEKRLIDTHTTYLSYTEPTDIDFDGDYDLLSSDNSGDSVYYYRNQSIKFNTAFHSRFHYRATGDTSEPKYLSSVDIDKDGDLDFLAVSGDTDDIALYQNDISTTPSFKQVLISESRSGPSSAEPGDINADGYPDIIAAFSEDESVYWFTYDSEGHHGASYAIKASGTTNAPSHAIPADIDRDGDLDVVVMSESGMIAGSYIINWYENDGTPESLGAGDWTEHKVCTAAKSGPGRIAVADLNLDGFLDVAAVFQGANSVYAYRSSGSYPIAFTETLIDNKMSKAADVKIADIDQNGYPDIIAGGLGIPGTIPTKSYIAWYKNDSSFTNTLNYIDKSVLGCYSIYPADINNDGDIDVASVYNEGSILSIRATAVMIFQNNGAAVPAFSALEFGKVTGNRAPVYNAVIAEDFNNDGKKDILYALSTNYVKYAQNTGGQYSIDAINNAPATIGLNGSDDVLKLIITNKGELIYPDMAIRKIAFQFKDNNGNPLTNEQIQRMFVSVSIFYDANENGIFDPAIKAAANDAKVIEITNFETTNGVLEIDLQYSPDFGIDYGTPKTYFIVPLTTTYATAFEPHNFNITYLAGQYLYADYPAFPGCPVIKEYGDDLQSSNVEILGEPLPTPTPVFTPTPTATPTPTPTPDYVQVTGRVYNDTTSDGIENVRIFLYTDNNGDGNISGETIIASDFTDASGNYDLTAYGIDMSVPPIHFLAAIDRRTIPNAKSAILSAWIVTIVGNNYGNIGIQDFGIHNNAIDTYLESLVAFTLGEIPGTGYNQEYDVNFDFKNDISDIISLITGYIP